MTVLLQVSDAHFGTERAGVLAALEVLVHAQRPDVLVLSGDITQRARRAQFAAAHDFVARLGIGSVLAIPGNHDIPLFNVFARLMWPYAGFRRAFGDELEPQLHTDALWVLTVKTTRRFRHVDGQVDDEQIESVARRLQQAPARAWRVVVVHQPVAVTREKDGHNLLHGRAAAIRRWAEAGADVVMGGHIHLPFVLPLHERDASLPRRLWAVQAGTAISHRVRAGAPNSVNLLRIEAAEAGPGAPRPALLVERWDHLDTAGRFERVAQDVLADSP
jgi:3',5'-cyclic AMP phosphodiesterase CpdA